MLESVGPTADGAWPFDEYIFGIDRTSVDDTRALVTAFAERAIEAGKRVRVILSPCAASDPGGFAACWNPLFAEVQSDWHLHVASDEAALRAASLRAAVATLPAIANSAGLLFREVLVDRPVVSSVRCLRTRSGAHYQGTTHSQLVVPRQAEDVARVSVPATLPDVALEHYKSASDYAESRARHLAMAQASVDRGEDPADYNLYLLGQARLEARDEAGALEAFVRAIGVAPHGGRKDGVAVAPWIPFAERIVRRLQRKATGDRPFVGLAVICKDAGDTIDGLLRSTVGCPWGSAFDEYVFVDTGSTDGTVTILEHWREVAESHGARFEIVEAGDAFMRDGVFDFASARNASFARTTSEWVMWLDADDWFLGADYLASILWRLEPEITCVSIKYDYSGDSQKDGLWQDKHRCFRQAKAPATWHGRDHESTSTPDGFKLFFLDRESIDLPPPFNATVPFYVRHGNLHPERSAERNEAILRVIYAKDGPHEKARAAYFLGHMYAMQGRPEAEALLREAVVAFPWNYIGLLASTCLAELLCSRGDYEAALAVAGDIHARLPEHPEPIWTLALIHRRRGDFGRAALWFRKAIALPDEQWRSHRNERLERHDGPLMAAETFRRLGWLDEAHATWLTVKPIMQTVPRVAVMGGEKFAAEAERDDLHVKVGNAIARERYMRDVLQWIAQGQRLMTYSSEASACVHVLDALPEWLRRHPVVRRLRATAYDKVAHKDDPALYAKRYGSAFHDTGIVWAGEDKLGRTQRLVALAKAHAEKGTGGPHILAIGPNGGFIETYALRQVPSATCTMVEAAESSAKALREKWAPEFGGRVRTVACMEPADWPCMVPVADKPCGFDIVAIFEVIEHVPDPVAFLAAARDRLVPGGVLLLSTPDTSNAWLPDMEAAKAEWLGHLRGYTPVILRDHLREAGMEARRMESDENDLLLTEAVAMGATGA